MANEMKTQRTEGAQTDVAVSVVDCDVHPAGVKLDRFVDYVPEPWRSRYFSRYASEVEIGRPMIYQLPIVVEADRPDAIPPDGGPPGSDPEFASQQLFGDRGADYAILDTTFARIKWADQAYDSAICTAVNSWIADTWVGENNWHGRYRGSIRVNPWDIAASLQEIERWAGHPYMVQIQVFPEQPLGFGQPPFHPLLECAARHRLPIYLHIKRQSGMHTLTPVGIRSYHNELFTSYPVLYMSHVTSLIFDGAFEKFPALKVVLAECGFSWAAPFMWRLDRHWKELGSEVSDIVKRKPSDYFRERVRITTQPVEEAVYHKSMHRLMDWMRADEFLVFSSDYPHYDEDTQAWTAPRLPRQQRDRIMAGNAIELYRLPTSRAADQFDLLRSEREFERASL